MHSLSVSMCVQQVHVAIYLHATIKYLHSVVFGNLYNVVIEDFFK